MIAAFLLALRQLADPGILRILGKCVAITLVLFVVLGALSWWAIQALLARWVVTDATFAAETIRTVIALFLVFAGGWLLWRILALAVLQFHADEVVEAVEARHYPAAHAQARPLGLRRELTVAVRGALRAIGYNLLALPIVLVAALVGGIGTAVVFLAVNAVLLGRELTEMVWLRHAAAPGLPLGRKERFVFGGIVAGLFTVPVANFLAPILGAAMATHLVHRKGAIFHAS